MASDPHQITLAEAVTRTSRWQAANPNAITAVWFAREAIDRILAQPGCDGLRLYNAQQADGSWTMVLVGTAGREVDLASGELAEEGLPCPPNCDRTSPLGRRA